MKPVTAVCVGVVLSFCVFAVIIQVTDTEDYRILHIDSATGLKIYNKNGSFTTAGVCFENTVQINNIGFHGPYVSLPKGKDVFRILIIGSSFIEARQVAVADMYSTQLQRELNADPHRAFTYEVIPMGVNTNKLLTNALYYAFYGSALKPDLVIAFQTQYELDNTFGTPIIDAEGHILLRVPEAKTENPKKAFLRDQLHRSKLLVNIYNRYLIFHGALTAFLAHPFFFIPESVTLSSPAELAKQDEAHWQEQSAVISALASRVESDHSRLLIASWLIPGASTSTVQTFAPRLEDIATRNHSSYVDLTPVFMAQEVAEGKSATFSCDFHWTPAGNRYIADALYQYLASHPALLKR